MVCFRFRLFSPCVLCQLLATYGHILYYAGRAMGVGDWVEVRMFPVDWVLCDDTFLTFLEYWL